MANPRIKGFSLYYKSKRWATLQNATYTIKSGDTQELADGGAFNTDGIVTIEISCDTIVPLSGTGVSVVLDAISHNDVQITVGIVDGKIHELEDCRNTECTFTSETTTGKLTGKFTWHGSLPRISG
jgi:hypothetical protein